MSEVVDTLPEEEELLCFGSVPVSLDPGSDSPPESFVKGKPFRFLSLGDIDTLDGRPVKCDQRAIASLLGALSKQTVPVPLTLEHDDSPGRIGECSASEIRLLEDGFWCLSPLWSPEGAEQIRSGRRTFASATFYADKDETGTIRPRRLRDISLVTVPNDARVGRISLSAQSKKTSPYVASSRKEQETMKFSAEFTKLLALPEDAGREDVERVATERLISQRAFVPVGVDVEAMKAEVVEKLTARIREDVSAQLEAKYAEAEKARRVSGLLERATAEGKVVADNREALAKFAASDPDAFDRLLPALPVLAPVKRFMSATRPAGTGFAGADFQDPASRAELADQARRLSAEKAIPFTAAVELLTAATGKES